MIHKEGSNRAAVLVVQMVPLAGPTRALPSAEEAPRPPPWRGFVLGLAALLSPAAGSAQKPGETADVLGVVANVLVTTEIANCAEADSFVAIDEAFEAAKKLDYARNVLGGAEVVQATVRAHEADEEREARSAIFKAALEQRTDAELTALEVVSEAAARDRGGARLQEWYQISLKLAAIREAQHVALSRSQALVKAMADAQVAWGAVWEEVEREGRAGGPRSTAAADAARRFDQQREDADRVAHEARVGVAKEWSGLMAAVVLAVMEPAADWRKVVTVAVSDARIRLGRDPSDSCRQA